MLQVSYFCGFIALEVVWQIGPKFAKAPIKAPQIKNKHKFDCFFFFWSSTQHIYHLTLPHDPEGILGTLTAIFTAFLGLQVSIFIPQI